ncbi:hypothetical protein PMAYCL1PPCAC_02480 [Pristionchus mayeri]|uniref:Uncharacterized protein n=1 Tax=Pristionchus mayeri TaxID=1317129 RepID=A0AAN5C6A1_9BILA|nr:hypothetical protein PMAYCL1PPCAC_02480 [Pristionchus mayeri]
MLTDISIATAWFLMTILVTVVAVPGFALLYYLHSLFPAFPEMFTLVQCIIFSVHAGFAVGISLFAILVYSDVAYPIVIYSFAQILSRQALAREPPPNMQYYLPHDETLNGSINRTCEDSQMEKDE